MPGAAAAGGEDEAVGIPGGYRGRKEAITSSKAPWYAA